MTDEKVKKAARKIIERGQHAVPFWSNHYAVPAELFEALVELAERSHD